MKGPESAAGLLDTLARASGASAADGARVQIPRHPAFRAPALSPTNNTPPLHQERALTLKSVIMFAQVALHLGMIISIIVERVEVVIADEARFERACGIEPEPCRGRRKAPWPSSAPEAPRDAEAGSLHRDGLA